MLPGMPLKWDLEEWGEKFTSFSLYLQGNLRSGLHFVCLEFTETLNNFAQNVYCSFRKWFHANIENYYCVYVVVPFMNNSECLRCHFNHSSHLKYPCLYLMSIHKHTWYLHYATHVSLLPASPHPLLPSGASSVQGHKALSLFQCPPCVVTLTCV